MLVPAIGDAQDILIKGARVHTASTAGTLENADILVQDGRIAAVGGSLSAPAGATVIEANGRPVTPGLFGGISQIGLEEVNQEEDTYDAELKLTAPAWQHMWRPEFDVTPAFNARSAVLPVARIEGHHVDRDRASRGRQPHRRPGLGSHARRPLRCRHSTAASRCS